MNTIVSIIIPVYNVDMYICRCLDSILAQTYKYIDVIAVNDASTDDSIRILKSYVSKDNRIHIINNANKRGPMMARWQGIEVARGEYLTFVDADDCLPNNAIEILLNTIIREDSDLAMGTAKVERIDGSASYLYNTLPYGNKREDVFHSSLTNHMTYSLWAKIYKTKFFRNYIYEIYDNCSMAEDKCLIAQYINNIQKASYTKDIVYHYIKNSSSLTESLFNKKQIEDIIIAHKMFKDIAISYPSLKRLFYDDITFEMILLFLRRCEKCNVKNLLKKHSMFEFVSPIYGIRYLSKKHIWILLKTFVYNKIHRECNR